MAGQIPDSVSTDWCTPDSYLDLVRKVLGPIGLDPCSNPESRVDAAVSYCLPQDGLTQSWDAPTVFFNPPFGRVYLMPTDPGYRTFTAQQYRDLPAPDRARCVATSVYDWVARARWAHDLYHSNIIGLIPAYVDTRPWQQVIYRTATAICFPKGRVKFRLPPRKCTWVGPEAVECGAPATYIINCDKEASHCEKHARARVGENYHAGPALRKLPANNSAPMACALPYWGNDPKMFAEIFSTIGHVEFPTQHDPERASQNILLRAALQDCLDQSPEMSGDLRLSINVLLDSERGGRWSAEYIEHLDLIAQEAGQIQLPAEGRSSDASLGADAVAEAERKFRYFVQENHARWSAGDLARKIESALYRPGIQVAS